jgi:hypothetical protein
MAAVSFVTVFSVFIAVAMSRAKLRRGAGVLVVGKAHK